jgi:hypothetical protein
VYHNTVYGGPNPLSLAHLVSGAIIKNNIFYSKVGNQAVNVKELGILSANVFDNNLLFRVEGSGKPAQIDGGGVGSYTFAEWQALTGSPEPHGINANPLLVTDGSDFHLQAGSPAIGAGADLSADVVEDYDGVTRTTYDVGAFTWA